VSAFASAATIAMSNICVKNGTVTGQCHTY
jgi:hypothetical protein